mgnify:CR=1 FL=1
MGERRRKGGEGGDVTRQGGAANLGGGGRAEEGRANERLAGRCGGGGWDRPLLAAARSARAFRGGARHAAAKHATRVHAAGAVVANEPTRTQSGHAPSRHHRCGVAYRGSPPSVSGPTSLCGCPPVSPLRSDVGQQQGGGSRCSRCATLQIAMPRTAQRGGRGARGGRLRSERPEQCPRRRLWIIAERTLTLEATAEIVGVAVSTGTKLTRTPMWWRWPCPSMH